MIGPFQVLEPDDEIRTTAIDMRARAAEAAMKITARSKFNKVRETGYAIRRAILSLPLNLEP